MIDHVVVVAHQTIWTTVIPLAGVAFGFGLSKLNDWWNLRPRGYLKIDEGHIYYLADDNRCLKSESPKVINVLVVINAHVVNQSGSPLTFSRPSVQIGGAWPSPYDTNGQPIPSDTIPPNAGRDYTWVFVCEPSTVQINQDTQYEIVIRPDRGKEFSDRVKALAIVTTVKEGEPIQNYLHRKGW